MMNTLTEPGAGLPFIGTPSYLVDMRNLQHALRSRRDLLFKFYDINNFEY